MLSCVITYYNLYSSTVIFGLIYFLLYRCKFLEPFPSSSARFLIHIDLVFFFLVLATFVLLSHLCSFIVFHQVHFYGLYIRQLLQQLKDCFILRRLRLIGPTFVEAEIRYFLVEHTHLARTMLQSNRDIWSLFLFAFVPIQLLTMVFLSYYLIIFKKNLPLPTFFTYLQVLYMYTLLMVLILCPLAYVSQLMHRPSALVYRCVSLLPSTSLLLKLKFAAFFERLASKESASVYGFSIGAVSPITFAEVGEVCSCLVTLFKRFITFGNLFSLYSWASST